MIRHLRRSRPSSRLGLTIRWHGGHGEDHVHRPDASGGVHPLALSAADADVAQHKQRPPHAAAAVAWLIEGMRLPLHRRERRRAAGLDALDDDDASSSGSDALRTAGLGRTRSTPLSAEQEAARARVATMEMSDLWALSFEVETGEYGWRPRAGTEDLHRLVPEFLEVPIAPVEHDFIDVGCGDGRWSRAAAAYLYDEGDVVQSDSDCESEMLVGVEDGVGWETLAVDPSPAARAAFPAAIDGTADAMPSVRDDSVHAIVAADAFQWFATVPSLFEIARVLPRRGYLGLVWTSVDWKRAAEGGAPWAHEVNALLKPIYAAHPELDPASAQWRKVFENFLGCYFGLLHYGPAAAATRTMDASELGALVLAPLAGVEEIEELRAAVEAAVQTSSAGGGEEGRVVVPFLTKPCWCQLLDK